MRLPKNRTFDRAGRYHTQFKRLPWGSNRKTPLAGHDPRPHAPAMFVVSERDAAAIRTAFDQGGELSAAVELRRLFLGITDSHKARAFARTIAGWKPLPMTPPRPSDTFRAREG